MLYSVVSRRHWHGMGQRLGFVKTSRRFDEAAERIWLHASSVGEVQSARALLDELKQLKPDAGYVLSCMTVQGVQVARKQVGHYVECIFAPLDLPGVVHRALRILRPTVYICLETELWPCMIRQAHRNGTRLLLLNGRMTERSFKRYLLVRGFMREILSCFERVAVIQEDYAGRYAALGADPDRIVVLGNAKYDQAAAGYSAETERQYRSKLALTAGQVVFVAGSTHTGEEEMLHAVFAELKGDVRTKDPVWIVAPRHLDRLQEVAAVFRNLGVDFDLLSDVEKRGRQQDVILVDSMGELAALYSVATFVFCGGSLVDRGGHNVMEAAIWGKPVFYGPSMKDFADAALLLESAGAGYPVRDTGELIKHIQRFVNNPEEYREASSRAKEIATAQQGSSRKQAMLVTDIIGNR